MQKEHKNQIASDRTKIAKTDCEANKNGKMEIIFS